MKAIFVYIFLNGSYVPAGHLVFEQAGRFSYARFKYGEKYLAQAQAISLDPVQLPLLSSEFTTPEGFELFNGIRDAGPDRWGRYLLDKKYVV